MNENGKSVIKKVYNFVPAVVIIFVLGFVLGIWTANTIHDVKIADSIKLQRFLYKTTDEKGKPIPLVYNITPNVDINK